MNEWKNMKEHDYACQNADTRPRLQSRTQNMFCYLDFCCYFEANGQNHIHFRLIQFLKNSMAWHFLTFTSPSSKLLFVYSPCSGVEEQMLIFSPIPKLTIVLIWKTPACLKFGKTSNRAAENSPQRNSESGQRTMHSLTHRTSPCFYLSCSWRSALWWRVWLNAMHCGKKWWIGEFVPPYIFPLNPDYVAPRSLRSLLSN